ncbi:hypothetical protein M409DRAFT_23695 [Zasmidium cellare ATCC 36951]|uniref:2EXR domain-containing protein n=1 Tax=Zasmidium cellare ATCC 36951 TaxID=1080233 RepID=A0A6A6CIF9_ZASCE|nr:uncharacterized protein M409DRAFT_23695 [Zasmidium cellare ATCC 36951]KAF2165968.1 hypothetical protein M409DRAFT_23695 [Zasmidium cellare ATCC 36951]
MYEPSSTPQKPNLFTLPRELRDLIYEFACEGSTASIKSITPNTSKSTQFDPNVALTTSNSNVSILQVSSQIRHEVEPIYYRRTIFTFSDANACIAWLKRRVPGPLLRHLRHLRVGDVKSRETLEVLKQKQLEGRDVLLFVFGAGAIRQQATSTLKLTLNELTDEGLKLGPGVVQVAVLGSNDCEMVWTATLAEIAMPFIDY